MYFVDREKIEEILDYMDKILEEIGQHSYTSFFEKMGLERIAHVLIESIMDTGNMMIDGFIMRDPGSYTDIIDILVDEKVLPETEQAAYKEVIELRKMVVKQYIHVDHDHLLETLKARKAMLEQFSTHIRNYLENELGVANAFTNK